MKKDIIKEPLAHEEVGFKKGYSWTESENYGIYFHFFKHYTQNFTWEDFYRWIMDRDKAGLKPKEIEAYRKYAEQNANLMPAEALGDWEFIFLMLVSRYKDEINEAFGKEIITDFNPN
ncbi:MAG: hypothetical protein LAT68_03945 [Cyclobacteriaceae bacterium]|nr:hypothetical protein [Cyclobacteriaceae bacterium]MCH8515460.1 hypothetical protein [Cyclobacteriaceae bacterium]